MTTRYLTIADINNLYERLIVEGPAGEKRMLIEGDSWASYPLPSTGNLAQYVRFPDENTVTFNLARVGDELAEICWPPQFDLFERLIHDDQWGYRWDLIFLVAGGNDLIGWILVNSVSKPKTPSVDPADYVDRKELLKQLLRLKDYYQRYINARNNSAINPATPILVQTYDYITPRNQPPTIFDIPLSDHAWVHKEFEEKGIEDSTIQREIFVILLNEMIAMLKQLEQEQAGFHVVDTRNTLEVVGPDYKRTDGDWHDEMHPSAKGYKKLADHKVNPAISALIA